MSKPRGNHLLGCANHGYEAREAGKPMTHPYKLPCEAKGLGLYRARVEHWEGGWREADAAMRRGNRLLDTWGVGGGVKQIV